MAKQQKQGLEDLKIQYRCERCWSNTEINLYPKSDFLLKDEKGFVILCLSCRTAAPKEVEKVVFEDLFLEYASPKELIQHYHAKSEKEALSQWCLEHKVEEVKWTIQNSEEDKIEKELVNEETEVPFGFQINEGKLQVNQKKADIVKRIYEKYLDGNTMEQISRSLECAPPMSTVLVRRILKDPVYAGYVFKGNDLLKGDHKAIIDIESFNSVQKKIVRNIRNPKYVYHPLVLGA
ncbi:MAG: recombinase family protein [Methanomassiliicoccales archaeon]|nr:MAG: recombinase family protein [Methanomassiliicoccales archaeon]